MSRPIMPLAPKIATICLGLLTTELGAPEQPAIWVAHKKVNKLVMISRRAIMMVSQK